MDQVFDLRDFLIKLIQKFKLAMILGIIFAILGASYGYFEYFKKDLYTTTSTATISLKSKSTADATALTSATTAIEQVVKTDYFYTSMIKGLYARIDSDKFVELCGSTDPSLKSLTGIIQLSTKGNMIFVDISSDNKMLSQEASRICVEYASERIALINTNITATYLSQQSVNINAQKGSSVMKETAKYGILGLGGGIVLAILFIFFFDVMSLKIASKDDLRKYNLPILGEISKK